MGEIEVPVYCYWNGCIKYGPEGVYYEESTPKKIIINPKISLNRLLDEMYALTRVDVDEQRSKIKIFGRYPSVVRQSTFQYLLLPVVNNHSLETMLEVPSKHPCIQNVELYLEVKSDGVTAKRQRTDIASVIKLERRDNNSHMLIEDEADAYVGGGDMTNKNSGSDAVAHSSHKDLNKESSSGVCLSSLWLDDHDLRVGLRFKDVDELKKAVDWCSIRGMQKCVVRTGTEECMFECVRWKCKWSLGAARMEKHSLFEIIKYTGPHTCRPIEPENFDSEFEADETERLIRVNPTMSVAELNNWWKAKIGCEIEIKDVAAAKTEAIKRVFGDWEQSFEDLPKLMSAFHSSNGLLVDWKYDIFPNPKFASFCGVFWAFPQSIQGFQHCRPLIIVDTKELKYQLKLMIAAGLDAANEFFPLAFAVTKHVSSDSWRWFLTNIREKVTQRKGLCLISSPHPDILSVINEPGSRWIEPWAYHRFCLKQFSSQFSRNFPGYKHLESLLNHAGSTSQTEEFDNHMETIKKEYPVARRRLDLIPQNQWSLVHDSGGRRYGFMEIDTAALFSDCRVFDLADDHVLTGSLLLMFDELRASFEDSSGFSRASLICGDVYTKPVTDKLEEFRTASFIYVVMPLDDNGFQVAAPLQNDECIVRLNDSTCTCGDFQRCKFPCLHALAVCKKLKINPLQYVDECYTFERYYKTYAATFSPVPELSAWPEASGVPRLFPPVMVISPPKVSGKPPSKSTPKNNNNKS